MRLRRNGDTVLAAELRRWADEQISMSTVSPRFEVKQTIPPYFRAAGVFLIRVGVWSAGLGAACAGLAYVGSLTPHPEAVDSGSLIWVIGLAAVALGVLFLVAGVILRSVAALFKTSAPTA